MTVEIRQASPERVPALAAMFARAFADDPLVLATLAAEDRDERARRFFMLIEGQWADLGFLWEAGDAAGAAAWVPPEHHGALADQNAALQGPFHALTADGGVLHDALWDWIESRIPDEPLWFLDSIGVEPDRQGEGIGGALVEFGLDQARRDKVPAFLETGIARNVAYYERFGFRLVEEGDAPLGGPHVWFMRFDP